MTLTSLSDQDLVNATRDGDERAFEELYGRYRQRITGFVLRLTRDPDRADDITQEVFISALRRLRESDRPIVLRPWLYEIARNACIDEYRRSRRAREVPIERDGVDGWLASLATAPPPEVAVESKQRLENLRGAFRGLSERHHKIIVLRELEGKSYSQIGDELGMSKIVVESTLFRARRRLTEEYEDLDSGRRCEHITRMLETGHARSLGRLGLRDRRMLSRHLEHCQPCRRLAVEAGLASEIRAPALAGKVAAMVPVPLLALLRRFGLRAAGTVRAAHDASLPASSTAAQYVAPIVSVSSSGRFAAAAATIVAAALGGGLITTVSAPAASSGPSVQAIPAAVVTMPARVEVGAHGPAVAPKSAPAGAVSELAKALPSALTPSLFGQPDSLSRSRIDRRATSVGGVSASPTRSGAGGARIASTPAGPVPTVPAVAGTPAAPSVPLGVPLPASGFGTGSLVASGSGSSGQGGPPVTSAASGSNGGVHPGAGTSSAPPPSLGSGATADAGAGRGSVVLPAVGTAGRRGL